MTAGGWDGLSDFLNTLRRLRDRACSLRSWVSQVRILPGSPLLSSVYVLSARSSTMVGAELVPSGAGTKITGQVAEIRLLLGHPVDVGVERRRRIAMA